MTTDFKASQVQTSKVIVTGSFAGGSANQLLVYSIDADDSGTPNQGVIDTAAFSTSEIGSDVFLFVSGGIGKVGTPGSYAATVFGGDTCVSGTLFSTSGVFSGDVVVSGTLYAERQVIEVDQFATGTLLVSGNFVVSQSAEIRQGLFVNTSNEAGFGIIVGGNGSFNNQITGSLSQGSDTQAVGSYSHAEGSNSISSGIYSHAEGSANVSSGQGSHAEGVASTAAGNYSHAEGDETTSTGVGSHSEGVRTVSNGGYSHAEGDHTLAKGYVAHAEGYYATGSGDYSHAEGSYTTASGSFSHAEGIYTFSIGEGSHSEGQVTFAEGPRSHAEGFNTHAFGTGSHAEGNFSYAYGTGSHAEGSFATGSGNYSHAEGFHTIASGTHQHVEGRYNLHNNDFSLLVIGNGDDDITRSDVVRVNRGTPGSGSFEVTGTIYATVGFSGSLTQLTDGRSYLVAGTDISITTASDGQVTIDYIGTGGGGAQYWDSLQDGAIYTSGSALFRGPAGSNTSPADFGTDTFFYVSGSIGSKDTAVTGTAVFGGDVVISGTLHGGSPLKIGSSLLITGAVSQGSNAQAVGAYSRAGGSNTIAFAGWSVAEGYNSVASGLYSHANGSDARSGKRAFELQSIGITSVDVTSQPPYAIYKVKNTYSNVTLEFSAYTTIIVFDTASNGGYYDYVNSNYDGTNTYVTASDAYGNGTFFATSADKISNGAYVNQPSADQNAGGDSSHAEGYRAVTVGIGSHAEGEETVAVGAYSHAEGVGTVALGNNSHAEGENAISSGDNSHAEGYATIASGTHSHAEGFLSFAKGDYSHAEGRGTQAIGEGSHTEGYVTWAIGPWSHAGGLGTFASGAYQTVVGKYNVSQNDTSLFVIGDGVFVIGDGPNSSNRSDIVRVNSGTLPGSGSFEVTGTVRSTLGFSGSLTHLTDGTSYLIAGNNVTITSESNGAVTIASTGGGSSPEFWFSTGSNEAYTTGSVFINAGANGNQNLIKFDVSGSEFSSLGSNLLYPARGSYIVVNDVSVADASWNPISGTLKIAAASVMASGSGGEVYIFAGDGGYASGSTPVGGINGGLISLYPGAGGASDDTAINGGGGGTIAGTAGQGGSGYTMAGAGGFVSFSGGAGGGKSDSNTTDQFTAGAGGAVYLDGGTGGSPVTPGHIDFIGGQGGDVSIAGGSGGISEGSTNSGGQGGAVTIYGGTGGSTTGGGTGGAGGSVIIQPGDPGLDATGQTYNAGNFEVYGSTLPYASASNNASIARFGIVSTGSAFPNQFKGFKYIIMNDPVDDPGLGGSAGSAYLDAFLYVSGTIGSKGTLSRGVSIFGGDAVASGTMNLEGGLRTPPTIVTSLPYTASITDYIIAVSASAGPGVALPSTALDGRNYIVKDVSGSAAADNIVVSVDGGGLVDGASSYTISMNRGSATFVYFGTSIGWGVI